ncbi:helix-turn-helix transcriptional regulator [Candidatus Bathyarchaeota archaeon]|nr:helix-turn-helix transcriptional regulator [Candidatus Bathyarchaeota archaeon]
METVKIIRDVKVIKTLADPVRREILRITAVEPLTETQLAEKLSLTKPSIAHHLAILREAGLIRVKYTKLNSYGILEKYYEPTARLFIEDWRSIPAELQKYFSYGCMERLRGMLSVLQLFMEKSGKKLEINSKQTKELADGIAQRMPVISEKYAKSEEKEDAERLLIKIYSETLKDVMKQSSWKKVFKNVQETVV